MSGLEWGLSLTMQLTTELRTRSKGIRTSSVETVRAWRAHRLNDAPGNQAGIRATVHKLSFVTTIYHIEVKHTRWERVA